MFRSLSLPLQGILVFYLALSASVNAAEESVLSPDAAPKRRGYSKGELMPVSCLNRTM
jgi:hypothetical protein